MSKELDKLVGNWEAPEEISRAVYRIEAAGSRPRVHVNHKEDGEAFAVSNVTLRDQALHFDVSVPSTGYSNHNCLSYSSQNRLKHELTSNENWRRLSSFEIMPFIKDHHAQGCGIIVEISDEVPRSWYGAWESEEDSSPVLEIQMKSGRTVMWLFDRIGKEEALLRNARFDGSQISFQSRFRSSSISHKHRITLVAENLLHHQLTFVFNSHRLGSL